jgi:hypothetical protein
MAVLEALVVGCKVGDGDGTRRGRRHLVVNVCGRKPGLTCDRGGGRSGAIACLFEVELRAAPACKWQILHVNFILPSCHPK